MGNLRGYEKCQDQGKTENLKNHTYLKSKLKAGAYWTICKLASRMAGEYTTHAKFKASSGHSIVWDQALYCCFWYALHFRINQGV